MSRFRVVLLSLFAVMALGAVGSATASADSCNGGSHFVFCFSPSNLPIHSLLSLGEIGLTVSVSKVGTTEIKFHCKDGRFTGLLQLLGKAEGEIDFLGCMVEKPANCIMASLFLAGIRLELASGTIGTAKGSGPGEELTTITLTGGSCSIPGTYQVTGSQLLEFPEGEVGKVEHELVAKKSGSHLKVGLESATLSTVGKVHLDSGSAWLIMAGE